MQSYQQGILFRGDDGELYFVPQPQLDGYRLIGNNTTEAKRALESADATPANSNLLALNGQFVGGRGSGDCCALNIQGMLDTLVVDDDDDDD